MKKILLVALACALSAAAADTGGKLTIYMAGKPVASETYTIAREAGKVQFEGSGNATIGQMKIVIEQFKVVTDDKYQPLEAAAKAQLGQMTMQAKTTFADGKAKSELNTGQGPTNKEDDVHADPIVVNSNLPLFPWSVLAQRVKFEGSEPQEFRAYVLGQSEVPLSVVFKGRETVEFATSKADLYHFATALPTANGAAVDIDFWVNDDRKLIKVGVPSQNVEAYQDGFDRKAAPEAPKTDDAAKPKTPPAAEPPKTKK
jgi:hypothetical protein